MKTLSYNPSPLETELANIFESLVSQINQRLKNKRVASTDITLQADNPALSMEILDDDGDRHHIVIKIIQKPDN